MFTLIIIFSFFLSSCGAIFPSKYNEVEYRTLAEISTTVSLGSCDKETTDKLLFQSTFLVHYTKHLPSSKSTYEAVVLIHDMVVELKKRVETQQPISQSFCTKKLELIGESVDSLQEASGGKVR